MKGLAIELFVALSLMRASAYEIGACTSRTPFALDIQAETRTVEMGAVKALSYDNKWQMPAATGMRLFVNGEAVSDLEGVDAYGWYPQRPGTYALELRSYVDGVLCEEVLTADFEVKGRDIVNAEVLFDETPILYDGTGKEPHPTVVCDGRTLVEGTDYTLSWENNVNAGVGKVVIKGIGAYSDEVEKTFTIVPAGICSLDICAGPRFPDFPEKLNYDQTWIGTESGDKYIRIFENGARITQETGVGDYAWTAYDRGLYTLECRTYVDGYKQEEVYTAQFFIGGGSLTQDGISVAVSPEAFEYDGQPKEPAVTVRFDGVALRQGIDYVVSYEDNIEIGTGYAVIRGIGDYSDEVRKSFTIYGSMGIRAISARQRYPWNGLVDIGCIADGEPGSTYRVTFSAMDMVGGTNLPMRTIWRLGGETNVCQQVTPQAYRFVWDAGEDLPDGLKLEQVKISTSASEPWANDFEFTVSGYTGSSTLSGVPVLVRLSSSVEGFDYAKMAFPETGKDLSFTSPDGETIYPHEIDTWNREGESLVWVRLPSVAKTGTRFKMRYGNPLAPSVNAQSVWSDYAGVWHLSEADSTAKDSTSHALNATAGGSPYTAGACGTARNGEVKAPNYNSLSIGNNFTASGWFRSTAAITAYPKPFYRNESGWADGGWGVEFSKSATVMTAVGSSNSTCLQSIAVPTVVNTWVYLTFVYNGATVTCYANGKSCKSGTIVAAKDNGKPLRIGVSGLLGDEVRLRKGTLTADRIKADYDIVANKNFLAVSAPVSRDPVITAADPIGLDLKRDSVRESDGKETLVYSGLWYEGDNATVTIAQDGAVLFEDLEGEGVKTWSVNRSGEYVLTHTTYNGGVKGKAETAVFVVEGKDVPVGELTIDWGQSSFVYDGQPKEPVITVKDRETTLTKGTHYLVEYKDNVNVGTAKAIVKGLDLYVGEMTNEFTITAAPIGPGGGEEPGPGEIPEGGLSKFDATYEYDGEGHTIKTQALYAVTLVGSTPSFSFSLDGETGWQNDPFVYTNVGEYVMWYKITAPNYEDYKHQAKVTIQPLVLTVTFDANGGSCPMASKTVTHGATYGTLPTPTWTGHIFAGWYTAASGGDEVKDSTAVNIMAPQTLYAHWVSVTGVSAKQRYPWNGLVDIVVAFEGESNDVAKVDCSFIATNSATKAALSVATITRKGADSGKDNAWSRQFVWDAGTDVGTVKIDDVAFTVFVASQEDSELGGVQLWNGGPYWAECNVGATKPEESGYYFWWGDTVGYRRNGNSWDAVDGSRTGFVFGDSFCPTWGLRNASLQSAGYIDTSCNLVPDHDAARTHFGAPWRLPTDSEISALVSNCDTEWTTRNGVNGRLVKGRGSYASKSIFLPAAGFGFDVALMEQGLNGACWSSVPKEAKVGSNSTSAWGVGFTADGCALSDVARHCGCPVRPVRGFAIPAVTTHLSLDCREGDRLSAGAEELTFSNLWDGDAEATVTVAQDGAAIFAGLSGEGVKTWTVDRNGRYELTHTTYTNGIKVKIETAVFVVEGKEVPVSELTIDWGQKSFVYDGQPKEPVITVKDRGTTLTKGTHYLVEYKDNINVGTAKAIVKGIEPYVEEVTNTFTITAATIDDEPGPGPVPVGGLSKFDATYVYDGEGHTINTQALYAVTLVGSTPSFSFSLDGETGWQNDPFVYTNVGEYVMWYKITAPNYEDYTHQAKVTIQPLVLTVTFDANGGSCPMASKTVTHGATYGTLPTPTWTGHIFAGWYTAASGGDEVKDSTAVSIMAPQTLYAHWVSVTGVSAKQRYPWNGLVDIVVTFEGESNDVAKVDCSFIATNSATKAELSVASITHKGADSGKDNAWSRQFVWNAGTDVGTVKIDDVVFTVESNIPLEGVVQLWKNGPYWAECNVGATKPEEYGYYFWWGDTVGYKPEGGVWNDKTDDWYYSGVTWVSSSGEHMTSSPFADAKCPTYNKNNAELKAQGYIDSTGNLVAAHDAAAVHRGASWRMPTAADFERLVANCYTTWMEKNGVYGLFVNGKGSYFSKSIFLPAAGYGSDSTLRGCILHGFYWSSTPDSDDRDLKYVWSFYFDLHKREVGRFYNLSGGKPVRPLREFAGASAAETVTTHLSLDCRTGDRVSAGTEELTFSNLWDGDAEATVTIAQDGAAIFTGLSGEGVKTWTVDRNGRYVLTHTTYTNGVKGKVETAVFVVEGKEVPVSELTIDWGQPSFVYDGQPKEPVITVKDRGTTLTKGTHYLVEYKDNVNVGTAKAIVKGIEPYVEEVTNTFTITAAPIGDDDDEPGPGPVPVGGLSKFDATYVYDGEGHTINTQALYAVTLTGSTPSFSFSLDGETGWQNDPFVYTNVGEYVMWYKITAPNYADYKHQAKVTIQPLVLTVTFDANGGSCPMASKTVTHGATYGTLPTPTWAGHIFAGWYTAVSGGDEVKDSTTVSIMAPQTLYAHWVSVTGVSAKQRYPWNELVDIVVAFEGESNDVAKVDCSFIATNSATKAELSVASITRKGADSGKDNAWSRQFVWDAGADVGAVKIDDVVFVVAVEIPREGGVRLWENGPYWAECNVGATKPEEYGYYFWWGDTVRYKRNAANDGWISVDGKNTPIRFYLDDTTANQTYDHDNTWLKQNGWIGEDGNLVAEHDAATAHRGVPWRMMTDAELQKLADTSCCTWTRVTSYNGKSVSGYVVKGAKDPYRNSEVFFPAAGGVYESSLGLAGESGKYWSSTPESLNSVFAWLLNLNDLSINFYRHYGNRFYGFSVRPVRGFAITSIAVDKSVTHFSLDCREGDRVSAGTEELTFSSLWDGDAEATVTISQDGAAIFTGLSGEGVKAWTVDRNGRYELTHTTYTNGIKGKVETAVFVVEGKEVPVSELTIDWGQKSFVYDGQPKEPVITVKDRGTTLTKGTHYLVEYKDNVNVGTAKAIVKGIEPYVEEVTNTFTITKGSLPDDVDPDPIKPDPAKPDEPYSVFDYVGVYDGEGHTIDTNGLAAAYRAAVGAGFAVSYAVGESGGLGQPATPWSAEAPVFTNAATNVVWYKVSSANYEDIVHPAKVAIVPRAITIASVDGTWTYDTTAHGTNEVKVALSTSGQETASPFPEGEGIEVDEASFPTITDVGEKDNAFEWAFAEGTQEGNYAVTVKYGKLKVNARTIGDDDKNWDIRLDKAPMYNGEVQSAPIIQVCYVKPDGNLDYIPYELAGNTATDAGNYKVKISGKGNYSGTVEKDWAIVPRNLKMTSGTETWMYDGVTHSNDTVTVTGDGFVEGEGATYAGFPQVLHFADAAEPVENTFTYKLNDNTKAKNYEIVTEKGKVAMTRRPIALTAPTKSKTYDGTALTFDESEIVIGRAGSMNPPTGGESGGFIETALPAGEHFTFSNFASITEAGQVAATFTVSDGLALLDDYDITVTPGATLTVQKSATEITVTAKSKSWTYDGEAHELHEYEATNLGTLVGGDKLEVTFSADSVVTTPIDGENQDGVVENTITSVKVMRGDVDVSDNYTLAWYPGALTVTKRPVTLTSKGASKSYDGTALTKHEVEVGGDGFVGEDGATYTFSGSQLDKGKSKNAFEYSLKSGTNAAYYEITKVEGELEVFPADISAGTEEDWEIVLGAALTYNGIAQVQTVTSAKFKGLDLDYTVSGNQQTDAGDYELTLIGQGNFTGTKKVAWKLNPKPLTLTAGTYTKVYDGNELMSFAATAEGFVPGEGVLAACTGRITDVGSCDTAVIHVYWDEKTKASNYAVTKVPGKLTVTPRPVTITSKNISKPYDGTPLKLRSEDIYTEGMVVNEKFYYGNRAERTEAGQTSATFTVEPWNGSKLTNYAITPVYGTITITKSATEIGVTARSKSWPYDAMTHELHEYDATNLNILQAGEELVVTFKEASKVTTPKDGPGEDGKVANEIESIRVVKNGSQDVTDNYTVTPYPGLLTVTKRPVTVTVEGETVSATYDGEEHTASGYDIATEDELYDIAAKTTFGGTDEVARTDAGKSEMGLKPSDFTNSDEYFDVTYAVTDGWVDIEAADISAGTEQDFVLSLGANPKYNGTVQTIPVTAVELKIRDGEGAVVTQLPVTYTLAGENATHAGTYTLTVKANGNFKGEQSTTWKILKRQVKLTSGSASRAYNGQPLVNGDVTVSGDGFIGVEGATYSVTGSQTLAGSSKNAFTYALKAGTQEGDYDIEKVEGDLTVTKAKYPGNIQWNVAADAATWMYDGQQHGVTLTGVPSGVTPHLTGNAAKDVGEYTASVTFDFDAANYEPPKAPAPLKWSVTARPLSLQTVNAEKPYDGFPLTVDKANITPGLSGYAEGESFDYFDLASITEVGETPATFKYRDSASAKVSNYAVSVVGGATLKVTVGGDQISVTARDGTWAYDATEHRKMEWDIVNGDKLLAGHEFRIKIDETKSVVKTPEDGPEHNGIVSNVFEYVKIVETETGADKTKNYNLFVYEGALQITNRVICSEELRVNSEEFTEKIEKTYDGEPTNVTVTAELLQPATVRYFGDKDCLTAPRGEGASGTVFTDAGEYVVWYTVAAQYYNTYTNKVEVKIDKRPITLTSPTKTKPFDGTALTFDGGEIEISMTSGETPLPQGESLVFSDFASITDAGRVDATFEYAAGAGTSLDNYEVTVKKGTLTVNASAEEITVTAKSGSWPYDGEDHVLHDCEVENEEVLQSGDELVVEYLPASKVTTPDDGEVENVITSVRVMRGGEDGEDVTRNYSIVTYTGKIKVVNATIRSEELRVKSEECVYDGEGHTISVEAVGLLTSPATVVYSATGEGAWKLDPMSVAVKNAGTHTIRYRVSAKFYNDYFGEATVKINPRPVTLLSGSATKTYDGTPLRKNEVKVKEGSLDFVDGEGVTTSCTSAQTGVGRIENGFNYEFKSGTLQDNYTIIPAFGWLEVTPGTLTVDPAKSGYNAPYDGKAHGPEVLAALSGLGFNPEACEITYALVPGDESAYSPTMPTLTDVGTQTVYVKIKAQNFEVVYAEMTVVVTEKEIADEMVQPGEDAFFFDGDAKKPTVDVQHIVDGVDICTENDYTVTYGTKADAGWWVTVTGKGNYSGTVTKIVPVLKRPVAPPVITSKSYTGKTQKPTIPTDSRWTVVANPGGINVGEYSNVVLRLTNTTDYKWKGGAEDQTDITLVFKVTRASNRWRTSPDMKGWTLGETPSEPSMGQALYGTVNVAYRRKGAAAEIETSEKPSKPGKYLARFWVDETENFIGLATKSPYKEVEFEIVDPSGGGDVTVTTPVPVPHDWLDAYVTEFGGGDYETAGNAKGKNGVALWESYVACLNPTDPTSQFRTFITMGSDGKPVITWEPDMSKADPPRTYTTYGKANLLDKDWTPVTDANRATMHFFKVGVEIK